jgi:Family of unknown function (DUF6361)
MSGLFWLASSERERQKALELAKALQQKESRDELGIGTIRDGLADLLFPGTSTLHTRARYHLFIPWAYQMAARQTSSRPLRTRVREQEARLISELRGASDNWGLIGSQAGASLKRMPSELYWQGLLTWGIRRAPGNAAVIERLTLSASIAPERDSDGQLLDPESETVWHRNLPAPTRDFPEGATFALTYREADFLLERLRTEPDTKSSALAQLAEMPEAAAEVEMLWDHPLLSSLTDTTQTHIDLGRRASQLMYGASILYNVILAAIRESSDLEEEHRDRYSLWATQVDQDLADLIRWDLSELWLTLGVRVPVRTRQFVTTWQRLLREDGPAALVDSPSARFLIKEREIFMKGASARTVNAKAMEQWAGYSAMNPLDFRWSTARGLLADIRDGLETQHAAH